MPEIAGEGTAFPHFFPPPPPLSPPHFPPSLSLFPPPTWSAACRPHMASGGYWAWRSAALPSLRNAGHGCIDLLDLSRAASLAIAQAVIYMSHRDDNSMRPTRVRRGRCARRKSRLAAAAQRTFSIADRDEVEGTAPVSEYDTKRPTPFRGQDYFPEALGRHTFTIRPDAAALSAANPQAAEYVASWRRRAEGRSSRCSFPS